MREHHDGSGTSHKLLAALMVGLLLLVGCSGPDDGAPDSDGGSPGGVEDPDSTPDEGETGDDSQAGGERLVLSLSHIGGENLDPSLGAARSKTYLEAVFDYLVGCDANAEPDTETGVAQDWSTSDDSTVWTFDLRDGVTFSNGEELTAEDVKFSLEYFMREASVSANAGLLRELIASVEAPDDNQVVITTTEPYGFLAYDLSCIYGVEGMILPKDYIEENGEDTFAEEPVGSGPYTVSDQSAGSYIELSRVDDYWRMEPLWETIRLELTPDPDTRISQLQTGEADVVDVSRERAPTLEDEFGIHTREGAETVFGWLNNTWEGVLANPDIREAMTISIDRQSIVDNLFQGQAEASGAAMYGSYAVGFESFQPPEYDPERAQELVENSGETDPSITLYSFERPGVPEVQQLAEVLASAWSNIGINVEIVPTEYGTYRGMVQQAETQNSASVMSVSNTPLWLNLYQLFGAEGLLSSVRDDQFEAKVSELAETIPPEEFGEVQREAAEYLRDNYYVVPLVEAGAVYAANPSKVSSWELGKASFDVGLKGLYTP